jgi:hypothetical protein
MSDPGEYRRRARAYQRLADAAQLPELQRRLAELAATWEKLATDTEACEALLCDRQIETERPEAELGNQQKLDWVA